MATDPQTILSGVQADDTVKADAWQAFAQAKDADDLAQRLTGLSLPPEVKADLWQAKKYGPQVSQGERQQGDVLDMKPDARPGFWSSLGTTMNPLNSAPEAAKGIARSYLPNAWFEDSPPNDQRGFFKKAWEDYLRPDIMPHWQDDVNAAKQWWGALQGNNAPPGLGGEIAKAAQDSSGGTAGTLTGQVGNAVLYGLLTHGAIKGIPEGNFMGGRINTPAVTGIEGLLGKMSNRYAETSLPFTKADRDRGRTPGQFILDRTKGFSVDDIDANPVVEDLNKELETLYSNATPGSYDLHPARAEGRSIVKEAGGGGSHTISDKMAPMMQFLTKRAPWFKGQAEYMPGAHTPIDYGTTMDWSTNPPTPTPTIEPGVEPLKRTSRYQDPMVGLEMKRQFAKEFPTWNPDRTQEQITNAARRIYNVLDASGDAAVPEGAAINQQLGSGMAVRAAQERAQLLTPTWLKVLNKFGAHTGALAAATAVGLTHGIGPGLLAAIAPEILLSPNSRLRTAIGMRAGQGLLGEMGTLPAAGSATSVLGQTEDVVRKAREDWEEKKRLGLIK